MNSSNSSLMSKIRKSCFLKLLLLDLILIFLFKIRQPECEPCGDFPDCPPCISPEQYFIIYFAMVINPIGGLYCLYKHRKNQQSKI